MAERITITGLYKQLADFRAQFDVLASNYAQHMKHEQPWMTKVDEALFGVDGDAEKPGLHRDVAEIKRYVRSGWALFKWTAGTVMGSAIVIGVTSIAGCQASGDLATAISQSNTQSVLQTTYAAMTPATTETSYPTLTPEPTPRATDTPTATLTPWAPIEVTADATPAIIVLGNANEPPTPDVWDWDSQGTYYSYEDWNVRECPDKTCPVTGSIAAGQTVEWVGQLVDNAGSLWLCRAGKLGRDYGEDTHGAQWCNYSFLAWDAIELWHGIREVEN